MWYLGVLAQTEPVWWEALPVRITMWGTAVLTAVALLKKIVNGSGWLRRLGLTLHVLGDTKQYPNGSTDLLSALTSIYNKQTELGRQQTEMQSTQRRLLGEVTSLAKELEDHRLNGHR